MLGSLLLGAMVAGEYALPHRALDSNTCVGVFCGLAAKLVFKADNYVLSPKEKH